MLFRYNNLLDMKKTIIILMALSLHVVLNAQNQDNAIAPIGKVGIGTISPSVELEVAGEMKLSNMSDVSLLANELRFLVIDNEGKLVAGDLITDFVKTEGNIKVGAMGTGTTFCQGTNVNWQKSNGNVFVCPNGYNFGVGTVNPSEKLQVQGMIFSTLDGFKHPDNTVQETAYDPDRFDYINGELRIPNGPGGSYRGLTISSSGGSFWTQSGSYLYHNTSNVGIGVSNPTEKLVVSGNALIDGNTIYKDKDQGIYFALAKTYLIQRSTDLVQMNTNSASFDVVLNAGKASQRFNVTAEAVDAFTVTGDQKIKFFRGQTPAGFDIGVGRDMYVEGDIQLASRDGVAADASFYSNRLYFENRSGTDADMWMARYHSGGAPANQELRVNIGAAYDAKFVIGAGVGAKFDKQFIVERDGDVAIGTLTVPTGYRLAVGGKIVCEEVLGGFGS